MRMVQLSFGTSKTVSNGVLDYTSYHTLLSPCHSLIVSMRLMYEVRCAHFFSSPDSDFRTESPEPHLSSLRHVRIHTCMYI